MSDPILNVEDVSFSYGHVQVLFDMSLTVQRGEALALLGTNGAGKSTLLRIVTGLERAASGRIDLNGEDVTRCEAEELVRRGIVMIPGGRGIFPDMTVSENLEMQSFLFRRRRSEMRAGRERALEVFPRMGERLNQRAGTMSGGEQQQLALAKALVLNPILLCIDELSLGLAPIIVEELLKTVRRIRESGVSLILVEQSLNVAAAMCERAVFMEKGEVRFEGATAELLDRDEIARAVFLGGDSTLPPKKRTRRAS